MNIMIILIIIAILSLPIFTLGLIYFISKSENEEEEVHYVDTDINKIELGDIPNGMGYDSLHPSWRG